jgi:hypothetical protein
MSAYQLTDEDKKRIKNSDYYLQTKEIIKSMSKYSELNVGEVYSISYNGRNNNDKRYIMSHGSSQKDKYLIVDKDEGFVFAKRLNSNGGTGKDVVCLTIRFPMPKYDLEIDDEQAESIIFSQEDAFDPFKYGKDMKKRKDKARNVNRKKLLNFKSANDAFNALNALKVGDSMWDATTLCGDAIVKWEVESIEKRATDMTPVYGWNNEVIGYGSTYVDQDHSKHKLNEVIVIKLKTNDTMPKGRHYAAKSKTISFKDLMSGYRHHFLQRPASAHDEQT